MITYSEFLKKNIDLSPLGFHQDTDYVPYYCTPKDANILASAGVDGIHYCTIPGFGELIFAISPMNFGECVHPIARTFEHLLRLLLSCVDMAALEQCYAWDEEQYKAFLIDCPATEKQQAVLDAIRSELGLTPFADAFSYVKELQAEFDYSEIPYTEDYYDPDMNAAAPVPTEWQVFFDGGYWTKNGKGRAGEEITLNRSFKITLSATLCATPGSHTTGSVTNGYATYEQKTVSSGSGIPVLIVTTNESNNTGYYNGDYYDPTAYWVKDGVFYTLRAFGDEADKDEITGVLEHILQVI